MARPFHEFCTLCIKYPLYCKAQCDIVTRAKEAERKATIFDKIKRLLI